MAGLTARHSYSGIVVCTPVTIPYERYSIESAHWWIGLGAQERITPMPKIKGGLALVSADAQKMRSFA